MIEFDAFTLFVICVGVMLIAYLARSARRAGGGSAGEMVCSSCGATHPRFARYCKRCGKPL